MHNYQVGCFRDANLGQCQVSQLWNWLPYQDTDKKAIIIISLENTVMDMSLTELQSEKEYGKGTDKSPLGMW